MFMKCLNISNKIVNSFKEIQAYPAKRQREKTQKLREKTFILALSYVANLANYILKFEI